MKKLWLGIIGLAAATTANAAVVTLTLSLNDDGSGASAPGSFAVYADVSQGDNSGLFAFGVDLTDAMLARAQDRIKGNGWSNVSLVQADAASFDFPAEVDAILSTYALTQVPECAAVIAHGTAALSAGGRWAVLDLKVPSSTPGWLAQLGTATARPFASIDEWIMRRPWEAIRAAMQEELADFAWTELFFGTAFLAAGSSQSGHGRAPHQP